jgi:excisionase family DNA binding protein
VSLLTAEQVAERLQVTTRYVWKLGREGELPRVDLPGKYVRFDAADVEAFVEQRKQGGSKAHVEQPPDRLGNGKRTTTRPRF